MDRMLMSNGGSTYAHSRVIHCPVRVPKGSRVAVKIGTTFTTLYGQIFGWAAAMPGACASAAFLERVGTAGTGVSVDAGAVLNTKGSWTSLGSNTYAWNGMFVNVLSGDSGTGVDFNVDIGIDLAGTKFIIVPDLYVTKGSGSTVNPFAVPLPCSVPAGSNLYARIQASTTTSTSRKLGICLHGMVT
ncbi:MAG: hypothetical protein K8U57_30440 [Planctomycetes bacterium]|nr:hypothetical protein [Planctomycetota bacterium]